MVPLRGNVVAGLDRTVRLADLDATKTISVQVALKLRNKDQLDDLIHRVSTPGSPDHGHYLTAAQFAARFGPTAEQVGQATSFLNANGFRVTGAKAGSTLVDARGTAGAVARAFHISIGRYRDHSGHVFFANDAAPSLPSSLASIIVGIHGLDNRYSLRRAAVQPHVCCATAPYTPVQIQTGYGLSTAPLAGLTGSGQTLGLVELADYSQANVDSYNSAYSLRPITPTRLLVDGGASPQVGNGGQVEVELDIELMHAAAAGAAIAVFEGPNTFIGINDVYSCMVNASAQTFNGPCPNADTGLIASANSTSWGLCEQLQSPSQLTTADQIFAQGAAQGQSFYAASGDSGGYDCFDPTDPGNPLNTTPAVDNPASDPNVTAVGGTKLGLNQDFTWYSEVAWPAEPGPNNGSGGGQSTEWLRKPWQTGPGVDSIPGNKRLVPDVALNADPVTGYRIFTCLNSSGPCTGATAGWVAAGGTSAGAPIWAAFTAVYNQYATCRGAPSMGRPNETLYPLAGSAQPFPPFNDVVTGDNFVYSAGANYDMVTGWGSLRASAIAQDLAGPGPAPLNLTSLDVFEGVSGDLIHLFGCGFQSSGGQSPTVQIDNLPPASATLVDGTELTVRLPAHALGSVSVTVANPAGAGGGTTTLADAYTYIPGGYTLDGYGGVHNYGGSPPVSNSSHAYWSGWNIARGIAICPENSHQGFVLDGYGGVHGFGGIADPIVSGYWSGWDIARGIGLTQCSPAVLGYVLDGYGGLHRFGNPLPPSPDPSTGAYWPGWDIASGVAVCPDLANSGYTMDGYGGVHNFGAAPPVGNNTHAYWGGWRIARGLAVSGCAGGTAGYTLDGFGGVHNFGTQGLAPSMTGYWSGWNIARGITVLSDGSGGYVLDGYGGLHPWSATSLPPALNSSGYWPGWDIARSSGSSS